jgi:hypothetical protein
MEGAADAESANLRFLAKTSASYRLLQSFGFIRRTYRTLDLESPSQLTPSSRQHRAGLHVAEIAPPKAFISGSRLSS